MELTFWLAHPCLVFFVCFMSAMAIFVGFCGVCHFGSQILESITGKKLEDMLPFLKE